MSKQKRSPEEAVSYLLKLAERISRAEEEREVAEEIREVAERQREVAELSRVRAEQRRVRAEQTRRQARTKSRPLGGGAVTPLRIAGASDLDS